MKILNYALIATSLLAIQSHANASSSTDSGHGYSIISTQDFNNVPMPEWMKHQGGPRSAGLQSTSKSGTVTATAHPASGHPSPSVTAVSGNITASLYNDTGNNQYYNFDEFVCVTNIACNERKTTISLIPGGSNQHNDTLTLNIQAQNGNYQNTTSCIVTGAGNVRVVDYASVAIN